MEFVIVLSSTKTISVVDLSEHSWYKHEQFNKLKEVGSEENKTFPTKEEAVNFMFDNFPKSMIDEEYIKVTSLDGNYCFER